MDAALACDASLVDAMRVMAGFQEGARVEMTPDAVVVVGQSRFPSPYSNTVFPRGPRVPASTLLDLARAAFPDRRYFLWARGALATEMDRLAGERAFVSFGDLPAMVIDAPVPPSDAPGVVVSRVTAEEGFDDFVSVSSRAYAEAGLPAPVAASLLARADRAAASADLFVARIDGEAIAAALSITSPESGVGGVYWVGTVPGARRRGAGDAVTRAVTNASFGRGATIVTLQASEAGEPIYRRMGYREVSRYRRYLSPAATG